MMNFDEYLESNEISTSQASKELDVSYETIRSYRKGIRRPDLEGIKDIERWSGGKVTFDSWLKTEPLISPKDNEQSP